MNGPSSVSKKSGAPHRTCTGKECLDVFQRGNTKSGVLRYQPQLA